MLHNGLLLRPAIEVGTGYSKLLYRAATEVGTGWESLIPITKCCKKISRGYIGLGYIMLKNKIGTHQIDNCVS